MSDYRKFDAALQSAGVCYETDEPMSAHTSFKIGGPADRFVEVKTVSELQAVLNAVSDGMSRISSSATVPICLCRTRACAARC